MNLCIPIETDQGLDSRVYDHFGSAPMFLIVDTDSMDYKVIGNNNQVHTHGMCQPVKAIQGEMVDGIVVGGIGRGALMKLNAAGYQVHRAGFSTVKETVGAFKTGSLQTFTMQDTCGGHGGGRGGCGHN